MIACFTICMWESLLTTSRWVCSRYSMWLQCSFIQTGGRPCRHSTHFARIAWCRQCLGSSCITSPTARRKWLSGYHWFGCRSILFSPFLLPFTKISKLVTQSNNKAWHLFRLACIPRGGEHECQKLSPFYLEDKFLRVQAYVVLSELAKDFF